MSAKEWLDRQSGVPDGDSDGIEPPSFAPEDDSDLHYAIREYLDAREAFECRAWDLRYAMMARGWEPR